MAQQGGGKRLHVVGNREIAPIERRARARRPSQHRPCPRARAAFQISDIARAADQRRDIIDHLINQSNLRDSRDRLADHACIGDDLHAPILRRHRVAVRSVRGDDAAFLGGARIIDRLFKQEAVELRLGQRIDALLLDRILRRHHHEPIAKREAFAVDRHGALLHRLQQRRLRLGRGAVDFVGEQQIGENRPARQREGAGLKVEQIRTDDVARHQIGRELDPPEIEPDHARETAREQRLGGARWPFEQHVPAREQGDEQDVDRRLLPDHGLADLGANVLGKRLDVFYGHRDFSHNQLCSACAACSIARGSAAARACSASSVKRARPPSRSR